MSQTSKVPQTFSSVQITKSITPTAVNTPVRNVTATSYTLTGLDSGKTVFLSNTSGVTLTLPPVSFASGNNFNVVLNAVNTAGSHLIQKATSDSACLHGVLNSAVSNGNVNSANTARSSFTFGTSGNVGDFVSVVGSGTKWFLNGAVASNTGAFA